jgi:hypothetical protein
MRDAIKVPPIIWIDVVIFLVASRTIGHRCVLGQIGGAGRVEIFQHAGCFIDDIVEAVPVVEAYLEAIAIAEALLEEGSVPETVGSGCVRERGDVGAEGRDLGAPGNEFRGWRRRWGCGGLR